LLVSMWESTMHRRFVRTGNTLMSSSSSWSRVKRHSSFLALDAKGGVSSQFIRVGVVCISISIHLSILVLWTCMNYLCDEPCVV
jgi:hypothetical protein